MTNEENYIPSVQEAGNESLPNMNDGKSESLPASAKTEDTSKEQWDYYNQVMSVEPDHKKHTGTNQTPAKKLERKKRKARKAQRASRKRNRK